MAIQREIWLAAIIEGLFASNSFMSKAFNADDFVNQGKTVHIPQAGKPSGVVKNRAEVPAKVNQRVDTDLDFVLDEYTTDPIHIPHADTVELSYDKRESVLRQDKLALMDSVARSFIEAWTPSANVYVATGVAAGGAPTLCKEDVLRLMELFNAQDVPQEGRYLLVDARMHAQLLKSLTESESMAFLACADAEQGILGKLFSFNVMMRSTVVSEGRPIVDADGNPLLGEDGSPVVAISGALAWHEQSVCRALGEVKVFDKENDPTYYGDIYSFLVRAGGRKMRKDEVGVALIVSGAGATGAAAYNDDVPVAGNNDEIPAADADGKKNPDAGAGE